MCFSSTIKGTFLMTYLLTMTWAYRFVLIISNSTLFQYGFILSNAAQGICFFVLFCYANKEVRINDVIVQIISNHTPLSDSPNHISQCLITCLCKTASRAYNCTKCCKFLTFYSSELRYITAKNDYSHLMEIP